MASIFFLLCVEVMKTSYSEIIGHHIGPQTSAKHKRVECILLVRNGDHGNGVEHVLNLAVAAVMLVLVWPHSRRHGQVPLLWEHLQRFAWTEAEMPEVTQQRDADSGVPEGMAQVRHTVERSTWVTFIPLIQSLLDLVIVELLHAAMLLLWRASAAFAFSSCATRSFQNLLINVTRTGADFLHGARSEAVLLEHAGVR